MMIAVLAALFFAPLAIGIATGNARSYLTMTAMSLVMPPIWLVMAICALAELRGE